MNAMKKLICLLLMLCAGTAAFAWGGREHRLIAYIAEAHLTPRTRQVLDRYLDQSIVEYSTWMDRYRTAPGYEITTYWHMVTIDKDGSVPPEPLRPNGDGDAVRQLTRAIERLRSYRELSDSTVNVNLKYVIHLVGEMHCPGHIYFADLPGGMDAPRHYDFFLLKYKGKEVTYHWVWDGSVSRQYPDWTEEDFRRELDKWPAEKQRAVGEGTPADWALECARSCRVVYDWAKPGDDIDEGFLREHGALPVDQALRGAYRLARVLNELFDNEDRPIMKHTIRTAMAALLCLAAVAGVRADDFAALRAEAAGRTVRLAPGTQLEALVVSDYRSQNMELNPNVSWDKVDLGENLRTAYVESPDGRYGFRLRFAGIYENRLERGDRVRLDLGGCSLTGETDPERYTVDGLCAANVEVLERGVALPAKERRIADLKDEDLYTYVTLAGTEFLSKQGCYANVFESCVQRSRLNAFDQPSRRTDGWASLLKDADNGSIYMLVNTKCAWRRDGRGVPHGVGAVSGVLVHTPMRRYGGDMGRYAIRPLDERDIAIPRDTASSYAVVAEWNWDRNYDGAIRFEKQGYTPRSPKSGVAGDRVLPDAGEGFLSTTSGARMRLDTEYDTRYAQDGDGKAMRVNAALRLDSDTRDWFRFDNRGRMSGAEAIVVETSTEGVEGRGLSFDFSFLAGNHDINRSWGYPVEWKVEYSVDGLPFIDAGRIFVLRPVVYNDAVIKDLGLRRLSYDAALGFTEYSVPLPVSLLGHKRLTVRLTPASAVMATIPENPADDSAGGVVTADFRQPFVLRLGRVAVRALR